MVHLSLYKIWILGCVFKPKYNFYNWFHLHTLKIFFFWDYRENFVISMKNEIGKKYEKYLWIYQWSKLFFNLDDDPKIHVLNGLYAKTVTEK